MGPDEIPQLIDYRHQGSGYQNEPIKLVFSDE
jgi:hypothetical protein